MNNLDQRHAWNPDTVENTGTLQSVKNSFLVFLIDIQYSHFKKKKKKVFSITPLLSPFEMLDLGFNQVF